MKKCNSCGLEKNKNEFHKNRSKKDGLSTQCKSCKKKTQGEWYRNNKSTHVRNVIERRDDLKRWLWEKLSTLSCVDCNNKDPRVLEFDHVRGNKVDGVSSLVMRGASISTLEKEISKCEVRCKNCHHIKTGHQFEWYGFLKNTPS